MTVATPGPYELYSEGRTIIVGDAATHTDLAEFFYCDEHTVSTSREEAEANARLFMSAPRLFEFVCQKAADGDLEARAIAEAIHAAR